MSFTLSVVLYLVALFGSWAVNFLGFPGNWLILIVTALYTYFGFALDLSWNAVWLLFGLALIGELVEFLSGTWGLARGGSKRGAFYGMLGSLIGSLLGASLGFPIPFIGPIIGILFFSSLGAAVGTVWGERSVGVSTNRSLELGKFAFWTRLIGSLTKILIGTVMVTIAAVPVMRFLWRTISN